MNLRNLATVAILSVVVTPACGGSKSPTAPAAGPTVTGVTITFPAGGTIYIGTAPQLQALETLSDGTTRPVAAAWSSDTNAVATVTQTGVVAAIGAGEATIAADANGRRGTLRVRVYPNFNGTWTGAEMILSCDDSGVFEGLCSDPDFAPGSLYIHRSRYTQTDAAVSTTIDIGDGVTASGPGTVSTGGELQLMSSARAQPEDPTIKVDVEGLHFRADLPARLTGTYAGRFTAPGSEGTAILGLRLESVDRTAAVASNQRAARDDGRTLGSRIAQFRRRIPNRR
jgi:hypothetical protein